MPFGLGVQQMRPEHERGLPEWQINEIDRAKALIRKNAMENPAIVLTLDRIENKMDEILKLLREDLR